MKKQSRPRILFAMSHAGFFRNFERTINHLVDWGYDIDLVFTKKHKAITIDDYPALREKKLRAMNAKFAVPLRTVLNYKQRVYRDVLFYAREEFRDAVGLRSRFTDHQKGYISPLAFRFWLRLFELLPERIRTLLDTGFGMIEKSVKPHKTAIKIIDDIQPDLIIVSPLVHFFTHEVEFVKAAKQRGIPTVLAVASWDNLTNKGIVKVKPDLVAVWNEPMAQEAVKLHGFSRENIVLTGATVFDWWYDKGELWSRDKFFEEVKQPSVDSKDEAATLLYLCSSASIANGSEVDLVEQWVKAVRNASDPRIRQARIIVRLHPMARKPWQEKISALQDQAPEDRAYSIYPIEVLHPTSAEQQAYFLNSVYYADAIVGLNTSAMIEAAIMGKPVLTFKGHGAEDSQVKNLHFQHLVENGCVRVSENLAGHIENLANILDDTKSVEMATREFVTRFVRPCGLDQEAAKCLARKLDTFFKMQIPTQTHHGTSGK